MDKLKLENEKFQEDLNKSNNDVNVLELLITFEIDRADVACADDADGGGRHGRRR